MSGIQEYILNQLRKEEIRVSIYLVNGFKLKGVIVGFDRFVVLLRDNKGERYTVYKHAISTIKPKTSFELLRDND